ncbi:DUF1294 domain-containing protein [Streptococcus caviae]|uniref:DUF1294 domain-containing protein n=1 Tax=Streptococcus sp. 'caviae' TaxID=1915004 RepID=UPI00094BBF3E|nr:DUF1294 domain-containing protein [Streptococcus sp. 'caviae']OLN84175.1 hypothetical protein BMI76_02975 [Streptococcus sp. 'caviae']
MRDQFYFWLVLILWNTAVFCLYGLDKRKAVKKQWRISERSLLLLSLCLGGLGAALGGHLFHHKTRKWYFHLVWYLGIFSDCFVIYLVWRM